MEETKKTLSDEEIKAMVKDALAAKAPKGPGEAGCRMQSDPMHRRWKMAVIDAPVEAK